MIYNPMLTLKAIDENKKLLKKEIKELIKEALFTSGIKITPEANIDIENKINKFIYEVYSNPCKYTYYLNQQDNPEKNQDN